MKIFDLNLVASSVWMAFLHVNFMMQLHLTSAKHIQIPSNFYGSSEVFSGYLSEQQQYIDAFTLHPDHVLISGTIQEIENDLRLSNQTGILFLLSCVKLQ